MGDKVKFHRGRIIFNPDDDYAEARYRARYPHKPGQEPNYNCASLADIYTYLVSDDITTTGAVEKLRAIRRAIRKWGAELPTDKGEHD